MLGRNKSVCYTSRIDAFVVGLLSHVQVLQPTIFDVETFLVWRNEAFDLWTHLWATAYLEDSRSAALLHDIHDSYYLVAIIDNDFFQVRWHKSLCIYRVTALSNTQ